MPNKADILLQQAAEALATNQYAIAEALQRQSCELLREQRVGESRLATEIEKLADIHYTQKKFDESAKEYAEVVQMREQFIVENDFNVLRPLYGLAKSHFEGQKYELAESEMRRALSLAESLKDSPESVAFCLYEIGWQLYYIGKYREAEPYLLKALPVCEESYGDSHSQTIQVLGGLALLYQNCPEFGKDAEPYFRRAIEASKSGADFRWFYLTNLYRLARLVDESNRFDDADELFLELLTILREKPEGSNSENWTIVSGCVKYFTKRGKTDMVADLASVGTANHNVYSEMVTERLEHAERTLAQDDPEFAEALLAAGNNATFEGKYREAEPLLTRALDSCTKIYGEMASQTLFALNRVCTIKRLLGKFDEAESAMQRAIQGARERFFDHGLYPRTLENLALLREAEAKTGEAANSYAQAVAEYQRILGFPSYATAEALYHQSGCLLRMGRFGPAETAIRRAISVMDEIEELSEPEKSDYLSTLASILEATGRSSEAAEMKIRAEQLFEQAKQQNEIEE